MKIPRFLKLPRKLKKKFKKHPDSFISIENNNFFHPLYHIGYSTGKSKYIKRVYKFKTEEQAFMFSRMRWDYFNSIPIVFL